MRNTLLCLALMAGGVLAQVAAPRAGILFEGGKGPGRGKHIVLVSGDEEYRSEEGLPQLAKILAKQHGFRCTVLFAIDRKDGTINPNQSDNIPGLEALARSRGGPLYLGALDEGKAGVVEWGVGARLLERSVFTAVLTADMGGGIQMSSLYEEADGDSRLAGAMSGGFGFDLGFSYFLLNLGMDVSVTPGSTVQFANNDGDDNVAVSVFPQPHAGIGVYFLRPIADTPTLSLQGDVSWVGPAHLAYGGRIAVGVPIDAKKNWFRVVVGGSYGPSTLWKLPEDPVSMTSAWLRVGVGSRL